MRTQNPAFSTHHYIWYAQGGPTLDKAYLRRRVSEAGG